MDNQHTLPPTARTPVYQGISGAAKSGEFVLQVCQHCARVQYPPRELCQHCLHDELKWEKVSAAGAIVSHTILHVSSNVFFREHSPSRIALVKLDCGPVLFAHLVYAGAQSGDSVVVVNRVDLSGEGVFIAIVEADEETSQLKALNMLLLQNK